MLLFLLTIWDQRRSDILLQQSLAGLLDALKGRLTANVCQ